MLLSWDATSGQIHQPAKFTTRQCSRHGIGGGTDDRQLNRRWNKRLLDWRTCGRNKCSGRIDNGGRGHGGG